MDFITVVTATYNRANLLFRPYNSLIKQTFKSFVWLIIDDGSDDNTQEVVQQFVSQGLIRIKYIKQENKGRAAAINTSYKYIETKYLINLDSDDEFFENTLEIVYKTWQSIPAEEYERFWCITGHSVDSRDLTTIRGVLWPTNINSLSGRKQHRIITKYKKRKDKVCSRKTAIAKQYPFPQYPDMRFVTENIVWEKINQSYDQFCINEKLLIVHTEGTDRISKHHNVNPEMRNSSYYASLFYLNECFNQITYNIYSLKSLISVGMRGILSGRHYSAIMKDVNRWYKRLLVTLLWPLSYLFSRFE